MYDSVDFGAWCCCLQKSRENLGRENCIDVDGPLVLHDNMDGSAIRQTIQVLAVSQVLFYVYFR